MIFLVERDPVVGNHELPLSDPIKVFRVGKLLDQLVEGIFSLRVLVAEELAFGQLPEGIFLQC